MIFRVVSSDTSLLVFENIVAVYLIIQFEYKNISSIFRLFSNTFESDEHNDCLVRSCFS